MAYFKIGSKDFSKYVNALKIKTDNKYTAQGNIPLSDTATAEILAAIKAFNVSISFLNPETKQLESNVNCIIPSNEVNYYTIQANNVKCKAFNLTFIEL